MSTAVVPFADMERMAATVAKSNLFGVKTPDQALALMCLAQAEGIHPMIAVRDYHIIDGKPSLKADTMLARFQEAGGTVEWHCMTDERCEATFVHAQSPKPIRIEWTIERAQRAGLTKKDNWRYYARPMLRSRVISEGVRSTYPRVIAGKYTPEEIESIPEPTPVAVEEVRLLLTQEQTALYLDAIKRASDLPTLKANYADAYRSAREVGDAERCKSFVTAYEERKAELQREGTP